MVKFLNALRVQGRTEEGNKCLLHWNGHTDDALVSFGCSKLGLPSHFCVSVYRAWKGSKSFLTFAFQSHSSPAPIVHSPGTFWVARRGPSSVPSNKQTLSALEEEEEASENGEFLKY